MGERIGQVTRSAPAAEGGLGESDQSLPMIVGIEEGERAAEDHGGGEVPQPRPYTGDADMAMPAPDRDPSRERGFGHRRGTWAWERTRASGARWTPR